MQSRQNLKNIAIAVIIGLLGLLLFADLYANIFKMVPAVWIKNWLYENDLIIINRIADIKENGLLFNAGFLNDIYGTPYLRQMGLAGNFYGILNKIFNNIEALRAVNALFLTSVLIYILNWVRKEFGVIVAVASYIVVLHSSWLILSANSLYWVTFLIILPMAVSIYFLDKENEGKSINLHAWGFWVALAVFLKCSCGYELITTVLINAVAPVFYFAYKNKWGWKLFLKRFLFISAYAIGGFATSFILCSIMVFSYLDFNIKETLFFIFGPIAYRTGIGYDIIFKNIDLTDAGNAFVKESVDATKLEVLQTYIYNSYSTILNRHTQDEQEINIFIIFGQRMIQLLTYFGICGIIQGLILKYKLFEEKVSRKSVGLILFTAILFAGPVSWLVLASPHAYVHPFIDNMLWSLPVLIFIGAVIALTLKNICEFIYNKYGLKGSLLMALAGVLFVLLFLDFYYNILKIAPIAWFTDWVADGEIVIYKRIEAIKQFGLFYNTGFLITYLNEPYIRQIGLAGDFYGILNLIFDNIKTLNAITVIFLCSVLMYILNWIRKEFGFVVAGFTYAVMFHSLWLIASAKSLYWVTYLIILPMAVSIHFLQKEDKGKPLNINVWGFWIAFVIFIKCACGFEFITNVMINAVAPIFYYAYKNKWGWSQFIKRLLIISGYALGGFFLCIGVHAIQVFFYTHFNYKETVDEVLNPVIRRTGLGFNDITKIVDLKYESYELIQNSLNASKIGILKQYLFDNFQTVKFGQNLSIYIIWGFNMAKIILGMFILGFVQMIISKLKLLDEITNRKTTAFMLLALISLIGPIAWFVLATPHAYVHPFIDYKLWTLPAVILIGAFIGIVIWNVMLICYNRITKLIKKV